MAAEAHILGLRCLRCRRDSTISGSSPAVLAARRRGQRQPHRRARSRGARTALTPASFPATPREPLALPAAPARSPMPTPVSLGEGATPLVHLERLGRRLGLPRLYAKDESQNPTWSYKDRLCSRRRHPRRRDRRPRHHHLLDGQPRRLDGGLRRARGPALRHLHARLRARHDEDADAGVRRRRRRLPDVGVALDADARGHRAARLVSDERLRPSRPSARTRSASRATRPSRARSPRTSAGRRPTSSPCRAATATGSTASGRAGRSSQALGLVKTRPRMLAAEPFGPLGPRARARASRRPRRWRRASSVAFSIASPYGTYQGLAALARVGRRSACAITDEGIFEAQRALAREEGIFAEPSAVVGAHRGDAARPRRRRSTPTRSIVVVLTSGGLKDYGASRTWLPAGADRGRRLRRHAPRPRRQLWPGARA